MTQPLRITIEKLVHGGSGMGQAEGKRIFVPYSAPGDVLEVEVKADHGGFAEAEITSIAESASCRVEPRCPVFGFCGGCQWQHLSYEAQLEAKRGILKETLSRIGKIQNPEVMETLGKAGFHMSYTYFTWRNTKKELATYLKQVSSETIDFMRPNFFVNTTDINPMSIRSGAPAAFAIRSAPSDEAGS